MALKTSHLFPSPLASPLVAGMSKCQITIHVLSLALSIWCLPTNKQRPSLQASDHPSFGPGLARIHRRCLHHHPVPCPPSSCSCPTQNLASPCHHPSSCTLNTRIGAPTQHARSVPSAPCASGPQPPFRSAKHHPPLTPPDSLASWQQLLLVSRYITPQPPQQPPTRAPAQGLPELYMTQADLRLPVKKSYRRRLSGWRPNAWICGDEVEAIVEYEVHRVHRMAEACSMAHTALAFLSLSFYLSLHLHPHDLRVIIFPVHSHLFKYSTAQHNSHAHPPATCTPSINRSYNPYSYPNPNSNPRHTMPLNVQVTLPPTPTCQRHCNLFGAATGQD